MIAKYQQFIENFIDVLLAFFILCAFTHFGIALRYEQTVYVFSLVPPLFVFSVKYWLRAKRFEEWNSSLVCDVFQKENEIAEMVKMQGWSTSVVRSLLEKKQESVKCQKN